MAFAEPSEALDTDNGDKQLLVLVADGTRPRARLVGLWANGVSQDVASRSHATACEVAHSWAQVLCSAGDGRPSSGVAGRHHGRAARLDHARPDSTVRILHATLEAAGLPDRLKRPRQLLQHAKDLNRVAVEAKGSAERRWRAERERLLTGQAVNTKILAIVVRDVAVWLDTAEGRPSR